MLWTRHGRDLGRCQEAGGHRPTAQICQLKPTRAFERLASAIPPFACDCLPSRLEIPMCECAGHFPRMRSGHDHPFNHNPDGVVFVVLGLTSTCLVCAETAP